MMKSFIVLLRNHIGLIVLLLVSFLVYAPSLKGGFVIDDAPLIKNNPYIRDGGHLAGFFTAGLGENSASEDSHIPIYRPLILVALSLGHALWGSSAAAYHLALLMLHLVNIFLVYTLVRKLAGVSAMAATFGAALFALHPTKVESVAWLSGMTDPLVTLFLLLALLVHQRCAIEQKGWHYLALSLLCFQMALWSKEVAIFFPLLVIAHDLIFRKKIDWPAAGWHAAIVAVYMLMRTLALGESVRWSAFDLSFSRAIDLALGYSELLALPAKVPFYILTPEYSVSSFLGWFGAAIVFVLAGFALYVFDLERRKTLFFSAGWFIGFSWQAALLMFYMGGYFSARFMYVPSVGAAVFAAALYSYLSTNHERLKAPIAAACMLVIAGYGWVAWKEIPAWRSNESIYNKVIESAPENPEGFNGLGHFYLEQENHAAAERNFLIALQKAKTPQARLESLAPLGMIYGMANNLAQSERYFREAVQIEPGNLVALTGLGNLAWVRGQVYEAIAWYEKALASQPENYEAAMNLAMAYEQSGQTERAASVRSRMSRALQH